MFWVVFENIRYSKELLMNNFMNGSRAIIFLVISSLAISLGGLSGTLYPMMQTLVQQAQPREIQDGWTPLHVAATRGTRTDIELLLAQGARKDAEDNKGRTPLFIAVEFCNNEAIQVLCERKADCTAKEDEHGMTPLHVASCKGLDTIAETLLAHRAAVDEPDKNKKTPLHVASSKEVVQVLLAHNAQPLLKDKAGLTPFDVAAKAGNRELVKAFLAGCIALRSADEGGVTALHRVAQCGTTPEVIKILLAQGGDVLSKNKNGMIPFHVAAFAGTKPIIETLLPLDASQVKAVDKDGETPLHWASLAGHADIADILVTGGANIMALNAKRMIPLHWACEKGAEPVARLLVARRSDVNAKAGFGEAPLHRAAGGGYTSLVEFLLNNGARVNEADSTGKTAHALAAKKGHKAVAAVLVAYGADASDQNNESKPQLLKSSKQDGAKALDAFRGEAQSDSKGGFDSVGSSNTVKRDVAVGLVPAAVIVCRVGTNSSPQLMPAAVSKQEVPKAVSTPSLPSKPHFASVKMAVQVKPVRVLENGKENPLHKAVKEALDYRELKKIIDPGRKVDLKKLGKLIGDIVSRKNCSLDDLNPEGLSALMWACGGYRPCYHNEMQIYPSAYTSNSTKFKESYQLQMKYTLMNANLAVTKLLLEAGADPQVTNKTGISPLMILASNANGYGLILWKLHNGQAQVNKVSQMDNENARKLKEIFVQHWQKSSGEFDALPVAVEDVDNENLYRMLPGHVVKKFSEVGNQPNFFECAKVAIEHGPIMNNKQLLYELVKDIIKRGAYVNHADKQGITPLMWACSATGGDVEIVKILLAEGADVNAVDNEGDTALHWATRFGHAEAVRYLLGGGADVNALNSKMENVLMLATRRGLEVLVKYLIPLVANINQTTKTSETALSFVCSLKPENMPLIKFLVEAGADVKQIPPSVYLTLSSDIKFMLEQLASHTDESGAPSQHPNPAAGPGQGLASQYARFEAEARWEKEEEHRKQAEADRRAQLAAGERATDARVAGNVIGAARLGANVLGGF